MSKDSAEKSDSLRCSTVAELFSAAKLDIERAFQEANAAFETDHRNRQFHEAQHHAYKYAHLVLTDLECKVNRAIADQ